MCALALLAAGQSACNLDNPGFAPPRGRITYPIGLALSRETTESGAPRYLYVANSNYDLRYNAGSVHAYDLEALASALEQHACRRYVPPPVELDAGPAQDAEADVSVDAAVDAGEDAQLDGGGDAELDAAEDAEPGGTEDAEADAQVELDDAGLVDARVPEFFPDAPPAAARDTQRGTLCDGRARQLPDGGIVSGDPEDENQCCFGAPSALDQLRTSEVLTDSYASGLALAPDGAHLYVPIRGVTRLLYLDVEGGELGCGALHRGRCARGPKLAAKGEVKDSVFGPQPTAIVTGRFAELGDDTRPDATFVATLHEHGTVSLFETQASGEPRLMDALVTSADRAVSLSKDDASGLLFLSSTLSNIVQRVGLRALPGAASDAPLRLYPTTSVLISGLSTSSDIRDVSTDVRARQPGEPERVFALVRGPGVPTASYIQALVFLELPSGDGRYASVVDAVRVGTGPTKLERVVLGSRQLLLVTCYDEGSVYIIDADARRILTVVREISGPFAMSADPQRQLLYVADFRASVVRVVDLHGLVDESAPLPRIVATLGVPTYQGGLR